MVDSSPLLPTPMLLAKLRSYSEVDLLYKAFREIVVLVLSFSH